MNHCFAAFKWRELWQAAAAKTAPLEAAEAGARARARTAAAWTTLQKTSAAAKGAELTASPGKRRRISSSTSGRERTLTSKLISFSIIGFYFFFHLSSSDWLVYKDNITFDLL